ncbi:YncE family protein [Ancylobacter terrae]|uniref:YncE family protein n=1 Tax=Ancylobacter sp. sgz301288 TaxID=3342077 RepID=UPI00385FA49F
MYQSRRNGSGTSGQLAGNESSEQSAKGRPGPAKALWAALLLAAAALLPSAPAARAQAQQGGVMMPGDAVVTGFAGARPGPASSGTDPADSLVIDLAGPSARIVSLQQLGGPPRGQLVNAAKPLTIPASAVGQVFGVTLDDATPPNAYLAATSAYGLPIVGADGARLRQGAPGAMFMPGLFGPAQSGGGPGSIWRIDGATGQVSLFTDVRLNNVPNSGAALGGLAFDSASKQVFAADRGTGMIHAFWLDGRETGIYDHGVAGRQALGMEPVADVPTGRTDITQPGFEVERPESWGYAPQPRLVNGLAVRNGRLYYSVAEGPQVWSIGINNRGGFGNDPRFEVEIPALREGIEISELAFDRAGLLYVAERGQTLGAYDFRELASAGEARVMRFKPLRQPDPNSGAHWDSVGEEYAVGMTPAFSNGNGGIAIGNGYDRNGNIAPATCGTTLWSTGERLRDPADQQAAGTLVRDGFLEVDGLQGNALDLVRPKNEPPSTSWFIDYDDRQGNPDARGHMGGIAIWQFCRPAQGSAAPPPPPPVAFAPPPPPPPAVGYGCPPGTYFDGEYCSVPVRCPVGTRFRDGACVYDCPPGLVRYRGTCVPPPIYCDPYDIFVDGRCVTPGCPPGLIMRRGGYCGCPNGSTWYNGRCVRDNYCPPGLQALPGGVCGCPWGQRYDRGRCLPNIPICQPWEMLYNGYCYPRPVGDRCPPGTIRRGDYCVRPSDPWIDPRPGPGMCRPGEIFIDGWCRPRPVNDRCPPGSIRAGDACIPGVRPRPGDDNCPPGYLRDHGACIPGRGPVGPGPVGPGPVGPGPVGPGPVGPGPVGPGPVGPGPVGPGPVGPGPDGLGPVGPRGPGIGRPGVGCPPGFARQENGRCVDVRPGTRPPQGGPPPGGPPPQGGPGPDGRPPQGGPPPGQRPPQGGPPPGGPPPQGGPGPDGRPPQGGPPPGQRPPQGGPPPGGPPPQGGPGPDGRPPQGGPPPGQRPPQGGPGLDGRPPQGGPPPGQRPPQGGPPPGGPPPQGGPGPDGRPPQGGPPPGQRPPQGGPPPGGPPPQGGPGPDGRPPQGGPPPGQRPPQGGPPPGGPPPQGGPGPDGRPPQGGPPPGQRPPQGGPPPGGPSPQGGPAPDGRPPQGGPPPGQRPPQGGPPPSSRQPQGGPPQGGPPPERPRRDQGGPPPSSRQPQGGPPQGGPPPERPRRDQGGPPPSARQPQGGPPQGGPPPERPRRDQGGPPPNARPQPQGAPPQGQRPPQGAPPQGQRQRPDCRPGQPGCPPPQ